MLSSRRMPAEALNGGYTQDPYAARKRSRSFGGAVAVPLGSAYSEPHRANARRSASNHRDAERERERMHRRYDSIGRHHPDFGSVVPANIASITPSSSTISRGRDRAASSSSHHSHHSHASHASHPSVELPKRRPSLTASRRATWQGQPSKAFAPALKIHRALAVSQGSAPAIFYDVVYSPAHNNILAPPPTSLLASLTRRSRAPPQPVPAHTLALPATRPFVPQLTLALPSPQSGLPIALPAEWAVQVVSMSASDPAHTALTNLDVLHAIYASLRTPVSRREWESLGTGSSSQRRIAEAYKSRCELLGKQKEWDAGVRRVDWLCGRTMMHGIEVRPDGQCQLVFAKPH